MAGAYFEINGQTNGWQSLSQAFSKLLYEEELMGVDPTETRGIFASHPDLQDRILKAQNTKVGLLKDETFEGLTDDGEVVATVTFELQRYSKEYELLAFVDTTPALGSKGQLKDIRINAESGWIQLDNKEDTDVEPGDTVGALFVSKKPKGLLQRITDIELMTKNVKTWKRVSATSAKVAATEKN